VWVAERKVVRDWALVNMREMMHSSAELLHSLLL
jgi:hypothetical protein